MNVLDRLQCLQALKGPRLTLYVKKHADMLTLSIHHKFFLKQRLAPPAGVPSKPRLH